MTTKHNILSIVLICASLSTAGCSTVIDEPEAAQAPITFGSFMSRAAVGADKTGMENFLVWGGFDGQNNLFNAQQVTPDGNYNGTRYWVAGKIHNFYALHPATLNDMANFAEGAITVTGFDTSLKRGTEAIDLMTAEATGIEHTEGKTPGAVPLKFSHRMSRIRFSVGTMADVTINDVSLWGISYKGDFTSKPDAASAWSNMVTATESGTPFRQNDTFLDTDNTIDLLGGELILIPQTLSETVEFSMTWTYKNDGRSRTVTVPLLVVGHNVWEQGKSYHYTATIPQSTADINIQVEVLDWNDTDINAEL